MPQTRPVSARSIWRVNWPEETRWRCAIALPRRRMSGSSTNSASEAPNEDFELLRSQDSPLSFFNTVKGEIFSTGSPEMPVSLKLVPGLRG